MRRPCLTCGRLIEGGSYCPEHQPPYTRFKQRSGGRQGAFRRATFKRYGLACIVCGSTENVEAAHDLALDMTPDQTASYEQAESGVPLCRKCHRRIDAAERRARRQD